MTRNQQIVGGSALGFLAVAGAMLVFSGQTQTPVSWGCADCPAGPATVTVYAFDPTSKAPAVSKDVSVTFPTSDDMFETELDLYATTYTVSAVVKYADGSQRQAQPQTILGLGDPVPDNLPTPTATAEPTPTGTPAPPPILQVPIPELVTVAPTGEQVQSGTDIAGNRWSIAWVWLMLQKAGEPSGDYALPGQGAVMGAQADHLVFVDGVPHSHEPRDGNYYRWRLPAETPVPTPTVTATPTPTVTPTPTPTVTPTPPPDPCVTTPLRVTGLKWPSQPTGSRTGSWNSGTSKLVKVGFEWVPVLRFVATDTRGCSVTVNK
jgi:hypothetical protein